ncbi:hypothetical protein FISHEDRAFT_29082, partial [Fistulina hepatica ATCC 64428]
ILYRAQFHSDGTRRRKPLPATMHGWLAKMRGTLVGNEDLRSQGMREMRAAKARKERMQETKRQQRAIDRANGRAGFFSLFAGRSSSKPS